MTALSTLTLSCVLACSASSGGKGGEGGDGGDEAKGGDGGEAEGGSGGGASGGPGGSGGKQSQGGSGGKEELGGTGGSTAGGAGGTGLGGNAGGTAGGAAGIGGAASGGTGAGGMAGGTPGVRTPPTQYLEVRGADLANPKAVILTIDDGPDGSRNTDKMLDTLKAEGVKATFCINTENAWFVPGVADAQAVVKRIVDEGHELCNHTVSHKDLTTLSEAEATKQMADVEATLEKFLPRALPLTLNRAPFMAVNPNVQKVLMKFGVHVQVDISSQDFSCSNAMCVLNNVMNAVNGGKSGFILIHGFSGASAEALPEMIKQLRAKGMVFKTTEDVVKAKYGKTSAQLYSLP